MSLDTTTDVACAVITAREALVSLEPDWTELWRTCPDATPFQSPAWLIPWWRHFGGEGLRVLCLRTEEKLVGVAPFLIWCQPAKGLRTLLLMGTGISDSLDVLVAPDFERPVTEAIREWLLLSREEWDLCDFQELPGRSILLSPDVNARRDSPVSREACVMCPDSAITVQSKRPVLNLAERGPELSSFVPPRMFEKFRYYARRAEKVGHVTFELARPANFSECFDALARLHSLEWQARGKSGVLAEESTQRFHREAAQKLLPNDALRLHTLRLNGQIIGCLYAFVSGHRTYYYLSGFDPEFSKLSPGTLLIGHAIECAAREGMREFDFLRGEENYKFSWGAVSQDNFRLELRQAG